MPAYMPLPATETLKSTSSWQFSGFKCMADTQPRKERPAGRTTATARAYQLTCGAYINASQALGGGVVARVDPKPEVTGRAAKLTWSLLSFNLVGLSREQCSLESCTPPPSLRLPPRSSPPCLDVSPTTMPPSPPRGLGILEHLSAWAQEAQEVLCCSESCSVPLS